jgi:hypothetical protein
MTSDSSPSVAPSQVVRSTPPPHCIFSPLPPPALRYFRDLRPRSASESILVVIHAESGYEGVGMTAKSEFSNPFLCAMPTVLRLLLMEEHVSRLRRARFLIL